MIIVENNVVERICLIYNVTSVASYKPFVVQTRISTRLIFRMSFTELYAKTATDLTVHQPINENNC